jgi:cell division topological specificity factor
MLDFLKALFRPAQSSGETAKERLRLVLLSDHLSLAPDVIESLKRDLLEVISRYVEIDPDHADVTFEQREREVAMLANIPITGVRDRQRPSGDLPFSTEAGADPVAVAEPLATTPALEQALPAEAPVSEPEPELELAVAAQPKSKPQPRVAANGTRRRRRKKYAAATQTKHAPQDGSLGAQASAQA